MRPWLRRRGERGPGDRASLRGVNVKSAFFEAAGALEMATQATEMSVNSVGTEFSAAHANCCVSCCKPCRICLAPISQKCRTDHLFFRLHGMPWKTAYGKPAGCKPRHSLPPALRGRV